MWKFDVEANHWSIQERGGSPRWDHVAALDTHGPNAPMLYIHGGRDSNNRPYPGRGETLPCTTFRFDAAARISQPQIVVTHAAPRALGALDE